MKGPEMKAFNTYIRRNEITTQYGIAFETQTECNEFVAKFPKYVNVKNTTITGMIRAYTNASSDTLPMASFRVDLSKNELTGEANETGVKRLAKFHEICDIDAIETTGIWKAVA